MTSKDEQVWTLYTRAVKPVQKKPHAPLVTKPMPEKTAARKAAKHEAHQQPKPNVTHHLNESVFHTLERKREKSLRQGSVEIDAKLDLHGLTQNEAFDTLSTFMRRAVKTGKRHLLIITGKGRTGTGVLRRNLESWLGELPEAGAILALRPAAPQHGGTGAFYVVLRKSG
jgi:DNA-nicking Smr family endonuclease